MAAMVGTAGYGQDGILEHGILIPSNLSSKAQSTNTSEIRHYITSPTHSGVDAPSSFYGSPSASYGGALKTNNLHTLYSLVGLHRENAGTPQDSCNFARFYW